MRVCCSEIRHKFSAERTKTSWCNFLSRTKDNIGLTYVSVPHNTNVSGILEVVVLLGLFILAVKTGGLIKNFLYSGVRFEELFKTA